MAMRFTCSLILKSTAEKKDLSLLAAWITFPPPKQVVEFTKARNSRCSQTTPGSYATRPEDPSLMPAALPSCFLRKIEMSWPRLGTMRTRLPGFLLLFPFIASADETFRCGNWIVSSDLAVDDLLKKCGEPTTRKTETQDVMSRNRNYDLLVKTGETIIETWTYNRGTQAKPMVVTIVDGKIKSIERQK